MKNKIGKFFINNWVAIVLAFVPPIIIWYVLDKETIMLTATLDNSFPLVSIEKDISNDIKVFYKSQEINSLEYIEITLENKGSIPIQKDDFEEPIKFDFNVGEITDPIIINKYPNSLKPILIKDSTNSINLEPLLLNPKDKFSFKSIIMNGAHDLQNPVQISSRIKGLTDIEFRDSTNKSDLNIPLLIGSILGAIVSLISFLYLFRGAKYIAIELPLGLKISTSIGTLQANDNAKKVDELAKKLNIDKYDTKANFMFMRLKLESLLADIARKSDLEIHSAYSITRLTGALNKAGLLNNKISNSIYSISSIMNKEMHNIESYLTNKEFEQLQDTALRIIAYLDDYNEKFKNKVNA